MPVCVRVCVICINETLVCAYLRTVVCEGDMSVSVSVAYLVEYIYI